MLLRVSNVHARILPRWNTQKTALLTALLTAFRAYCYVGTQKTALLTALLPALHLPQVMWSSCWAPYALEFTQFTVYAVYWLLLVQIRTRGAPHRACGAPVGHVRVLARVSRALLPADVC